MKVRSAMLANAAEIRDSLLYVLGGAPEWWTISEFGEESRFAIVVVLEADPQEVGARTCLVTIRSLASDERNFGAEVDLELGNRDTYVAGAPKLVPVVVRAHLIFKTVGGHVLEVQIDDDRHEVPFGVRVVG